MVFSIRLLLIRVSEGDFSLKLWSMYLTEAGNQGREIAQVEGRMDDMGDILVFVSCVISSFFFLS